MKPKILITSELPAQPLGRLAAVGDLIINHSGRSMSKDEIIAEIVNKAALICLLADDIDREIINRGKQLKVISNYAVGFNNIDLIAATARGIAVTNTPGVLTEATADLAWALLMAASRRIVEGDRIMRTGAFRGWEPLLLLGGEIHGKTLGIVGLGRIGQAMAHRAKGFGMSVLYYKRNRLTLAEETDLGLKFAGLLELLREADFVSLHVPSWPVHII